MPGLWKQKIEQTLQEYGPKPLMPEVLELLDEHEGTAATLFDCSHLLNGESIGKMSLIVNMLYRYTQENSEKMTQPQFETFKKTFDQQSTHVHCFFSKTVTDKLNTNQQTIQPPF